MDTHSHTKTSSKATGSIIIPSNVATAASNDGTTAIDYYPKSFISHLNNIVSECRVDHSEGAMLMVEVDNFAMVISGYGHSIAEEVMGSLQANIASILSDNDQVVRIQRDQFAIILSDTNEEEAHYVANRIRSIIRHFGYKSCYGSLHLNTSIAYVPVTESSENIETLLDKGYVGLDARHAINVENMGEDDEKESAFCRQEMGLANYLNRAIKDNRLRLAFQPIIESATGDIAHYEALLRIVGEDGTLSSVGAMIPIAERMGLISIIDELVLEMAVEEVKRSKNIRLAFNVSNMTTGNNAWLKRFQELLDDSPEAASRLTVEITETAIHSDLNKTASFVASIQAVGAQVALDDFGSGYTSFRQLKTLSLDIVKIDGAFIRDLADNHDNRFFVKTLLEFTQGFGLKTVAEFVENGEIAKILMDMGVTYMQGYYFGRPETHRRWLQN